MYTYKVINDFGQELIIPGFGQTVNGRITSSTPIENPNLELVEQDENASQEQEQQSAQVLGTPVTPPDAYGEGQPAPNHVAGVAPQNQQPAPAETPAPTAESAA